VRLTVGVQRRLTLAWILLGIGALIASGLLALALVLSRTPALQDIVPWVASFKTALVIHVDLSVVIWFLAFSGVLWSLAGDARFAALGWAGLALSALGTLAMALTPFVGADPQPVLNNYIPVLDTGLFLTGLTLVAIGYALTVTRALLTVRAQSLGGYGTALFLGAITAAIALMAFGWSTLMTPRTMEIEPYYELLFWGGGHTLQFVHVFLVGAIWAWATGVRPRTASIAFFVAAAPALLAPVIYFMHELDTAGFRLGFTRLMQYGHLGILPLVLLVFMALKGGGWRPQLAAPGRAALVCSLGLFAVGGVLGFLITGVNVVIPAHYHGSIVGVTLAFMGLIYYLLPGLGFPVTHVRLATLQPYLYGGGQLLHVFGLAWSGGHGVQRKVAGAAQNLDSFSQLAGMALMGIGGTIAVVGGVLFLGLVIHALWPRRDTPRRS